MNDHDQQAPADAASTLAALWQLSGQEESALSQVRLSGKEPALPSSFAVGTAAQVSIAVSALAAAELHRQRAGLAQQVDVDMRHAAIEFRAEQYLRVDGAPAPEFRDKLTRTFQCGDGRWVRIHANFPHHRDGVLRILSCGHDTDAVSRALQSWNAFDFEDAAAAAGMVVTAMRSFDEWDAHPQGQEVADLPLLSIECIGDAPPQPLPTAARPLSGVRVLDLTRVIAGPVCGRTLAGHGADVLLVTASHLPSIEPLVMETGLGKRACALDLRGVPGQQAFDALLRQADVLVQGYRPGGLEALGLDAAAAAQKRPGLVYVSLCAYGQAGPWAARRGFDSLVQTASGFNHAEAQAGGGSAPAPLPAQALDRATGYLMAYAVMAALMRRSREGGSWHVRLSLAQTGHWLRQLGRVEGGLQTAMPSFGDIAGLTEQHASGFGMLTTIAHAARMSDTPVRWDLPAMPLGSHAPTWLARAPG
ncbi:CoA transferase [Noviherbaspirillum sp. L7-7A]|uniref:CoA transferase n=1 Tax=Noviherbaspirillum sp. L7-7A TaxID=2850560 RepID=UPI001C2CAEC2|nr:CoA transferase [Noviherbaspirillum sp. L7-7A]MBV0881672.1 CoA transferase [Noviherbaspirillum sp. L7-7A]